MEAKHLEIQGRLENPKRKIVGASLLARLQGSSLPPPCVSDVSSKWFAHFFRIRTKNIHPKNIHPVSRMSPLSGFRTFLGSDQKIFIQKYSSKKYSSCVSDVSSKWFAHFLRIRPKNIHLQCLLSQCLLKKYSSSMSPLSGLRTF